MNLWAILIVVLVIVVLLVLFKFKELKHQFSLVLIVLLVVFLVFSVGAVFTENKLDLTTFDGVVMAGKLYFMWLGSLFDNIVNISGFAIHQDWILNNSTNKSVQNSTSSLLK